MFTAGAFALLMIGQHCVMGSCTPLYAISYGDINDAESAARFYTTIYGPNALGGDLWIRSPNKSWNKVVFRRPPNLWELVQHRADFTVLVPNAKLPTVLKPLSRKQIEAIDTIVSFHDGTGMKVYLVAETPLYDAVEMLRTLAGEN